MWTTTNTNIDVCFGESIVRAEKNFTDGYDVISAIEDDNCYVFILKSSGKKLQWIPKEIIASIVDRINLNALSGVDAQG